MPKKIPTHKEVRDALGAARQPYVKGWLKKWRLCEYNDAHVWRAMLKCTSLTDEERDRAQAFLYICDNGFFDYCNDCLGYHDLDRDFHGRMIEHITGFYISRSRLVEAFRGSFKSSLASLGYSTWLIAREYVVTGECNIRIGLQGEDLALPRTTIRTCREIMGDDRWKRYFGDHVPMRNSGKWGDDEATSALRTRKYREATLVSVALGKERTGWHFDVIIYDDLQAQKTSYNRDQIDKCWNLYRLNESLLNNPNISEYSEEVGVATRWHYDDIYARMERENRNKPANEKIAILVMPIRDKDGNPSVPTLWPDDTIQGIRRKQGSRIFACQYELNPVADEGRIFSSKNIKYWDLSQIRDVAPTCWAVQGVDMAWYDRDQAEKRDDPDQTVILTALVDPGFNIYIIDHWRRRGTRGEIIKEMFRQAQKHKVVKTGLCIYDQKYIENDIKEAMWKQSEVAFYPVYLPNPSRANKNDRIIGALSGVFDNGMIYLDRGMDWLEEEILDFPKGATDDGLDALTNLRTVAKRPRVYKEQQRKTAMQRHRDGVLGLGPLYWPDGERRDDPRKRRRKRLIS